ncbi:hypothetical protein SEPCBS119000_006056 [Sporothrix epigloea]|uniref:Uncharacterized protein n=1 Tax=Sporothrix epigloea TaxID=1892477 RepID=A0ABP0E532_9PEZI
MALISGAFHHSQLFLQSLRHTASSQHTGKSIMRFSRAPASSSTLCSRLHSITFLFTVLRLSESLLTLSSKGKTVVSVKGGCLEGLDWGAAIHIWTKTAMVPIPERSESHSEEIDCTDYDFSQEVLDRSKIALAENDGGLPKDM